MRQDSEEFQLGSQACAEKVRNLILQLSKSPGQNNSTALTGAICAVAELVLQMKPEGMEDTVAIDRMADTLKFYGAQHLLGADIDAKAARNAGKPN